MLIVFVSKKYFMSDELISFRVEAEQKELLQKLAALKKMSLSEFMRMQIQISLKSEQQKLFVTDRLQQIKKYTRSYTHLGDLNSLKAIRSLIDDLIIEINKKDKNDNT